jgi:lipopolysaccharide export system protein LptC
VSSRAHPVATLFPLALAGLLAALSFWLDIASRPQNAGDGAKLRHDPDYFVEDFRLRRFDTEGALQHTVLGKLMRHYPNDDSTVVTAPYLTYHRDPPTTITGREALLDSGAKHVQLFNEVRVTRRGVSGKPDSILLTEHLHAYPDDEIAISDVPATIRQGLSNLTGNTMNANNRTAIYELEGAVHGIFFKNGGQAAARMAVPPVVAPTVAVSPAAAKPAAKPKPVAKPKPKPAPKTKPKPVTSSKPKPKPLP